MFDFYNIIGLIGMLLTIIAYFLMSFGLISNKIPFQAMNAIGSACLVFSLTVYQNISASILEITWLVISLASIVKIVITKAKAWHQGVFWR